MSEAFENVIKVNVGTQKIFVDHAGRVTIVNAGPPGPRGFPGSNTIGEGESDHGELDGLEDDDHPQYFNDLRGDARYTKHDHEHPEYADFVYNLGFHGDISQVGGTYNLDGTITMPFLAFVPFPPGTTITAVLLNSPDSDYDKGYTYTIQDPLEDNDWVMEIKDTPFDTPNIGKLISINYDFSITGPVVGLIEFVFDWAIRPLSMVVGAQTDRRMSAQELLREEWDRRTAPVMLTNQNLAIMDAGTDQTWDITRATSRGTLPHTPNGLDIQWFGKVLRPYTQKEFDDSGLGLNAEPHISMFQRFYELITLTRPSIENDWFEWARHFSSFDSTGKGLASYFYENTVIGGSAEHINNVIFDTGVEVGQPERARMTLNTDLSTLTLWNWVPYDNADPTIEKCPRGLWWKPVFTQTHEAWASMANPETEFVPADHAAGFTEGNPEVIVPWRVGLQARLEIGELFMYEYGSTDPLVEIDAAVLEAAGPNSTSFIDGTGLNTISTISAKTELGPASRVITPTSKLLLPDPTSLPDGKIAKVVDGLWVVGDDNAGSPAIPLPRLIVPSQYNSSGSSSPSNVTLNANRLYYVPFYVPRTCSFDRIAVYHNAVTAAISGRLGLYDNVDDLPGSLVTEYGTVDLSTTAAQFKYVDISLTLPAGMYWLAFVQQGTGSCTFTCGPPAIPVPSIDNTINGSKFQASITGALPSTASPSTGNTTQPPIIYLRAI